MRPTDFFSWWRKGGRDLFCEEPRKAVTVHQEIPAQHDFEKELLVSVTITCDTAQSLRELQLMLRNVLAQQDIAKELGVQTYSTARYPVHARPVIKSLHQALTIWRLRKKYQDEGVRRPLYLLADDARLPISIQNKENDTATKNIKSVTASKTLAKAEALIKNVAMGRFPDDR